MKHGTRADPETAPPVDSELRARDMVRDALLAGSAPDLSRFTAEELVGALIGAERELRNVQGAAWPPLMRFQRTVKRTQQRRR